MRCIVAMILACLAMPVNAAHSPLCLPREDLIAELASRFGERLEHVGLQGGAAVVEVWVSERGSFTVFITGPDGPSCVLASGENWRSLKELPGIEKIPKLKEFTL